MKIYLSDWNCESRIMVYKRISWASIDEEINQIWLAFFACR